MKRTRPLVIKETFKEELIKLNDPGNNSPRNNRYDILSVSKKEMRNMCRKIKIQVQE